MITLVYLALKIKSYSEGQQHNFKSYQTVKIANVSINSERRHFMTPAHFDCNMLALKIHSHNLIVCIIKPYRIQKQNESTNQIINYFFPGNKIVYFYQYRFLRYKCLPPRIRFIAFVLYCECE